MAMNGNVLGAAIWDELRPYYEWDEETPPPGWDGLVIWTKIANEIVLHITGSGNATGLDSHGDTHNLSLV
jgi:hypothetical protein